MATRTHYDTLGVSTTATDDVIRAAYRRLAREYHPDRTANSSAAGGTTMPAINEAYRVLRDPGRRAIYDREHIDGGHGSTSTSAPAGSSGSASSNSAEEQSDAALRAHLMSKGPAKVPWRTLLVASFVAIVGIMVLAQFTEPRSEQPPDGILRNGDCVEILPNTDAREVACMGEGDLVVKAFITRDDTCPGLTAAHRDRQGMGVACVQLREV